MGWVYTVLLVIRGIVGGFLVVHDNRIAGYL